MQNDWPLAKTSQRERMTLTYISLFCTYDSVILRLNLRTQAFTYYPISLAVSIRKQIFC